VTGVALSGLASGLDTNSIITQLMNVEKQPLTRLQLQEQKDLSIQTTLQGLQTKVQALKDASATLGSVLNWLPSQTVSSASDAVVSARVTGPASSGAYSVNVLQLAQTAQKSYDVSGGVPTSMTITLDGDATKTITVSLPSGSTAQQAADAINADGGSPVSASVVTTGSSTRLVFTSRTSGAAGEFSVTGLSPSDLVTSRAGQDSKVTIDGDPTVYTSASNVVSGAIVGVELTLKSPGTTSVTASTPSTNADTIVNAVKSFVSSYNDAINAIRAVTTEATVPNPQTTDDQMKGLLHSDSGLNELLDQLRDAVGTVTAASGTLRTLADIGISTGATTGSGTLSQNALAGLLTVDEDKLRSALDTNPDQVRALLGATPGVNGLAQALSTILKPQTQTGGLFDQRLNDLSSEITDLRQQESDMQDRLNATQQRLQAQFTAMETALASAQSQSSWLASQIASLG
jgi:flagellar hook-associated protein 2